MKTFAKLVFGSLGCVLVISAIGVMAPRAVYAVVATIIRDQDQPARHAFTTNCTSPTTTGDVTSCDTPAIPAGQEFVIETISINAESSSVNDVLTVALTTTTSGKDSFILLNPIFSGVVQNPFSDYSNAQPLRLYADPNTHIHCNFVTNETNPSPFFGACYFSGYLVSLP